MGCTEKWCLQPNLKVYSRTVQNISTPLFSTLATALESLSINSERNLISLKFLYSSAKTIQPQHDSTCIQHVKRYCSQIGQIGQDHHNIWCIDRPLIVGVQLKTTVRKSLASTLDQYTLVA